MIKIKQLYKDYVIDKTSSEQVLKGIDLELDNGFNVLFGPSGCGKSTLLNIISGLDTTYQGDILIDDVKLRDIDLDKFHKDQVGFVFQNFNLVSHLTVMQNVMVALYLNNRLSKQQQRKKAIELLNQVGLEQFKNKLPNQLSGGQKQRVAIARALANDPSIIIADEPTGALDSKTSREILELLKNLANLGKTVIIVTHDPEVSKYADKIYRLEDGNIASVELISKVEDQAHSEFKNSGISLKASLGLAFSNFKSRLFRNVLVSLGSSIGIIGILLSLGLGNGIDNGVKDIFSSILSPTSITVTALKPGGGATFGPPSVEFSQDQVDEVTQILEKENLEEFYLDEYYEDVLVSYDSKPIAIDEVPYVSIVQKLDFEDTRQAGYSVENETLLVGETIRDDVNEVYITKDLAAQLLEVDKDSLNTDNLTPLLGQEISLTFAVRDDLKITNYDFTTSIAGVLSSDTFATVMYASDQAFSEIQSLTSTAPKVLSISAYANSSKQAEEISAKYADSKDYSLSTLGDVLGQISTLTSAITITLAFVAGLSLVVAAVMIAIVLYIGVIERTKEIGVLRALGYRARNIRFLFLTEAILIITISNIIAIIVSVSAQVIANPSLTEATGFKDPLALVPMDILFVFLLTVVIAVVAGLYPASKAAKLDPVDCLRSE